MAWLCIHTRPKEELPVQDRLLDLALDIFFPTRRITVTDRTRPGHSRQQTVPQYPRYLFADVDPSDYFAVPQVRGISQVVSTRDPDGFPQFLTVPPQAIAALRHTVPPNLAIGDQVRLKKPFLGLTAIVNSVVHLDSTGQVQVWLDMLGGRRSVSLHHSLILTSPSV